MGNESFFDESTEQSQVKANIVAKYFWAWATVIKGTAKKGSKRIAYLDLFAGPGRYKDGTKSTPLLIIERAIEDSDMRNMLVTVFNDADPNSTSTLQAEIDRLPGIERLKYKPKVHTQTVGTEMVKYFGEGRLVPTLFFVDPWGYKGLSLALINSVLKNWGCDCIFFFNYNRINMGLSNEIVREHMDMLFGPERAERVRQKLEGLRPDQRETTIVEELSQALREMGANFVLPFGFRTATGGRTSHYLIFASKHVRGYEIMKDIMAGQSSEAAQGVASFEYIPADQVQPLLFDLTRPLDDLEVMLLNEFASRTLRMVDIYEQHHVGKRYIKRNYKQVLVRLEAAGKIGTNPPAARRPKRGGEVTFADDVVVTFPRM